MQVLVIGAGIIGSIYGWALAEGRHHVVHLVRSGRAAAFRDGLPLDVFDRRKGHKRNFRGLYRLHAVETVSPRDTFELVIVPVKHYALVQTLKEVVPRVGDAEFLLLTQNWRGTNDIDPILPRKRYIYGDAKAGGAFSEGTLVAALKTIDIGSQGRRTFAPRKKSQSPVCLRRYPSWASFGHVALPLGAVCDDRRSVGSTRSSRKFRCDAE